MNHPLLFIIIDDLGLFTFVCNKLGYCSKCYVLKELSILY